MPWQSAPPLIIIAAMFTVTGVGMRLVDQIGLGRVSLKIKPFIFALHHRYKNNNNNNNMHSKALHSQSLLLYELFSSSFLTNIFQSFFSS